MFPTPKQRTASPEEIAAFLADTGKFVLTFVGYSGAGYQDEPAMLDIAEQVLSRFDPDETIVNIGATPEGIGAVYFLAKQEGFETTGIVSTQALDYEAELSPCVDQVFYVADDTWGGFLPGTQELSPTSAAMVNVSGLIVAIGGGDVARDELLAAHALGKPVRLFAADMNHEKARETARRKGLEAPTRFDGATAAIADLLEAE